MKVLILDEEGLGLAFAMKALDWNHDVRHWIPPQHSGDPSPTGTGIVPRISDWKPSAAWADLIVLTGNSQYRKDFQGLIDGGYPVLGPNDEVAEWETDREVGQEIFKSSGIDTSPFQTFDNLDKAIAYVKKEMRGFAIKPWGGEADKALSFVDKNPDNIIFKLERWKEKKIKGSLMLQELVEGVEMGTSGWFGPGGWCRYLEEDWEEKRLMNDGLGPNTGEQGTIVRFVEESLLFEKVLQPISSHLERAGYVGNINVNCIIDKQGKPWPLEFTSRLGWPAFNIQLALHDDDPVEWMLDLLQGKDTMTISQDVIVGAVLTHGDYPWGKQKLEEVSGFPIRGLTNDNADVILFQQVMLGKAPVAIGQVVKEMTTYVTAGEYVLVTTGRGQTVKEAQKACYKTLWDIEIGGADRGFRTDIGKRLQKELPILQSFGYAQKMTY